MTDLKPCPFCGSKNLSCFNNGYLIQIFCNACGARTGLHQHDPECDKAVEAWNMRAKTVKDQPDGDVVEVVRCKDCAFSREFKIWEKESQYEGFLKCECNMFRNNGKVVFDKHYCSFGERKDGDDND